MKRKNIPIKKIWMNQNMLSFFLFLVFFCTINIKTLTNKALMVSGDGYMYFLSKVYFKNCFSAKEFPLWNPYTSIGVPFAADVQMSVFNPFNILYLLLDTPLVFNLYRIIQLLIAAFFMYLFIKLITDNVYISWLTGMVYATATIMGGMRVEHNTIITTVAYFPCILYLLEKFRKEQQYKWLISSSIIMAVQFVSGFTQLVFYFDLVLFIYLVDILWELKSDLKNSMKIIAMWGTVYALLICIQLLPTIFLIKTSGKGTATWEYFSILSYDFRTLLMSIYPSIFTDIYQPFGINASSEINIEIYIGIICLIYAVFSIVSGYKKDRRIKKISLIALGSLIFGMLPNIPILGKILFHIPILGAFRCCSRSLPIFSFCIIILAGLGIWKCYWGENKEDNLKILVKINLIMFIMLLFAFITAYIVLSQPVIIEKTVFPDYTHSLKRGMALSLGLCGINLIISLTAVKWPKRKIMYILVFIAVVINTVDVFQYSLVALKNIKPVEELNALGVDLSTYELLKEDTDQGYRSFIILDTPSQFYENNILNIAKYGRGVLNQSLIYNSWLTFKDKKLDYWDSAETVYYPNMIHHVSYNNDFISMLGFRHIYDAWNHSVNTQLPDKNENNSEICVFEKEHLQLAGIDKVKLFSVKADWLTPDTAYKITFAINGEEPDFDIFYADLYASDYDDPAQDAYFQKDSGGGEIIYLI